MTDPQAPPGWYDDPENPGSMRYWDGTSWAPVTPPPPSSATPTPTAAGPGSAPGSNGFAIASLVLGILWLWWIGSILAVIFGHIALSQTAQPDNDQPGRGLAVAGLVLGYLGVASLVLVILLATANA